MKNFLVTGGAGFIGSNIVNKLIKDGYVVRVLDNFSTGKRNNLQPFIDHKQFELFEGDLRSYHIVRTAVKGVDYVLHQGALPSVPRSIADPITTNDVNILGTLNVLEASKEFNIKRVVFASSSSVYGDNQESPKREDMKPEPLSPYALSKYTGERYCQIFTSLYGLETVCLRYFNVFGPQQDPNSQYSAVIPKFINLILHDKTPIIYGDGTQSRDFTYVDNVVHANLLACFSKEASGQVINIACGKQYSLDYMCESIIKKLNKEIIPEKINDRPGDIRHSLADISKAKKLIHYEPLIDFNTGLQLLIEKTKEKHMNE